MLACFLTRRCLSPPLRTWQCKVSPISQHLCLSLYGSVSKAQTLLRTIFSDYSCLPNHGDLLCHHSPQIPVPCPRSCSLCQLSGREQWSCRSVPAENITQHRPEWKRWALTEEWTDAALHICASYEGKPGCCQGNPWFNPLPMIMHIQNWKRNITKTHHRHLFSLYFEARMHPPWWVTFDSHYQLNFPIDQQINITTWR